MNRSVFFKFLLMSGSVISGWLVLATGPSAVAQQYTPQQQMALQRAEAMKQQMFALHAQGNPRAAIPLAKEVLAIHQQVLGERHPAYAASLNNLGFLLLDMGDYGAARPYYEQALLIRKQVKGERDPAYALSLNNLGFLFQEMGDYSAALPLFEQALAIRKTVLGERHPDYAMSLNNLGALLALTGNYAAARGYHEAALTIRKAVLGQRHPDYAMSLNNLAFLLQAMGDYPAVRRYLEESLMIQREVHGQRHPEYAKAINNLGNLLQTMGDYAVARPNYERALAIYQQVLGEKHPTCATLLNNLGYLLQQMGDYAAARPYFEQALAIRKEALGEKHPDYAGSLGSLGLLLQEQGDYTAARAFHEQALAIRREALGENHPAVARSLNHLAALEAAEGHWQAAEKLADQARRIVRRHVSRVLPGLAEREQLVFLHSADAEPFHACLTLGLAESSDQAICDRSAAWLLNGKAVALESLAERAQLALESRDVQTTATAKELQAARRQLATLSLAAPRQGEEQARKQQLAKLEAEEQVLSRRLAAAAGKPLLENPWIELDAARAALPIDGVLVDIARFKPRHFQAKGKESKFGPARYAAWIIRPAGKGEVEIVDLGAADVIDAAVSAAQQAIEEAMGQGGHAGLIQSQGEPLAERALLEPFGKLARLVLLPITAKVGDAKQLLVSPDAALWLVPWGALPLADGRYAVEAYDIHYLISGRELATRPGDKPTTAKPVVMADPNYDLSPVQAANATRAVLRGVAVPGNEELRKLSSEGSALPKVERLPGTAAEAKAIENQLASYAHASPTLYTDQYALEAVFEALQRPKVLVLATHGFFLPDQEPQRDDRDSLRAPNDTRAVALTVDGKPIENPLLRCGLLLAGCNSRAKSAGLEDGVLTGMEIVGTDLRGTDLVVLSACQTGLGKVRNGEGVAGLRQAFQLAGPQAVVATLWQIPDRQSAKLMSDFFTNLAAGQAKSEALRQAQLAMIRVRRDKIGAAHPFFWAAFTLTGN